MKPSSASWSDGGRIACARADAWNDIFGLICVNDVTARNLQKKESQYPRCKGFDIVDADEAENVVPCISPAHAMRPPSDHDAELGFMVDAPDTRRQADRVARPDDRTRWLDEQERLRWKRLPAFGCMILVVEAHADNLRRHHRGKELHALEPAADRRAEIVPAEYPEVRVPDDGSAELAVDVHGVERVVILADAIDARHRRRF